MIDRPIRPLWPKGFRNEVQVICTVLSARTWSPPHDILCINGASAALMLSPLPFFGPVGAVRIGLIDGRVRRQPDAAARARTTTTLDLIVVGTKDGADDGRGRRDEVPEEKLLEALELAHGEIAKLCEAQEDLRRQAGKPKWLDLDLTAEIERDHGHTIWERIQQVGIKESSTAVDELLAELAPAISMDSTDEDIQRQIQVKSSLRHAAREAAAQSPSKARCASSSATSLQGAHRRRAGLEGAQVGEAPAALRPDRRRGRAAVPGRARRRPTARSRRRRTRRRSPTSRRRARRSTRTSSGKKIAVDKRRPDGRGTEEIRPIEVEVGVNPRAHGSGLFTRGQTQILSSLTLGTAKEGQRIDDLSLEEERRYMHHYNFPPYSVGETGFMRGPKRRDIGHGALAQRALEAVIPTPEEFPYTIRIVSETLESNGSSSMGSVCGSTLSLMDAGVPIKAPVSGIAMGLVKEGDDYVILTDIQGAEDHLGDMDFKVAGSRDGITALQMDIKITGVTQEIMRDALEQAKRARDVDPRQDARGHPGVARGARRERAADHDRSRSTRRRSAWSSARAARRSAASRPTTRCRSTSRRTARSSSTRPTARRPRRPIAAIEALTKEPEVGDAYTGKVVKTTQFGAFVELKKGTDGLLHVSNVGPGRVAHIEDVMSRGDVVDVVVQEVDKARGRIGLKLVAKHENGGLVQPEELIERAKDAPPRPPEEERPRRRPPWRSRRTRPPLAATTKNT